MGTNSKEYMQAWRQNNPGKMRRYDLKWRAANPEIAKESDKKKYKKYNRKCYDNDPVYRAQVMARVLRWRTANPEHWRLLRLSVDQRRRARKYKTRIGKIDFKQVLAASKGTCGICKKDMWGETIEFDHIIPLSKNGSHTQDNIQAAHVTCNRSKGGRLQ